MLIGPKFLLHGKINIHRLIRRQSFQKNEREVEHETKEKFQGYSW